MTRWMPAKSINECEGVAPIVHWEKKYKEFYLQSQVTLDLYSIGFPVFAERSEPARERAGLAQ